MFNQKHEIYKRRNKNNVWLGIIMGGLVIVIFSVTVVKLSNGNKMQAFDHSLRPEMVESGKKK